MVHYELYNVRARERERRVQTLINYGIFIFSNRFRSIVVCVYGAALARERDRHFSLSLSF